MTYEVRLPQYGMGMQEAIIVRWLKAVGDAVDEGEGLVEIEAEKADVVVESPVTGTLVGIMAVEGAEVEVREVIAIIEEQ